MIKLCPPLLAIRFISRPPGKPQDLVLTQTEENNFLEEFINFSSKLWQNAGFDVYTKH